MEWVETTGKTVDEALDAALDQLGVDEADAEYEVLEEPKTGLFGRVRGEARVRARVRPTTPRPKDDRRDRRRRGAAGSNRTSSGAAGAAGADDGEDAGAEDDVVPSGAGTAPASGRGRSGTSSSGSGSGPRRRSGSGGGQRDNVAEGEDRMSETGVDVPLDQQGEVAAEFVKGVVERFGVDATVAVRMVEEDTIEVAVEGDDLGLLIGPKGTTLQSLQELARTVVQRRTSARNGRLVVDVAGYRQRRRDALERFAATAAEQVLSSGARVVLDPMNASDRKVVHDAINEIAGVTTTSEGEDPRRRVVLLPEPPGA